MFMTASQPREESGYDLFIIDGKSYDLREWAKKHPGGSIWFSRSHGRDISAAVHAYHKDPDKLKRILKKYEVDTPAEQACDPSLNVPAFILPRGFDARRDGLSFAWDRMPRDFLGSVKEKLVGDAMHKKLARADFLFDCVGAALLAFHVLMMFVGVYYAILPVWAFVLLFVVTRTSLAAVGHYHCHRKKDGVADWGDGLFDMQYVGASLILFDGHVMLHHLYTNSPADVKRTVFTGMLELPRLWRVPVYTLHRFGNFLTGMFIRWGSIFREQNQSQAPLLKHLQFLAIRFLLVAEFFFCWATGYLGMWIAQFVLCLWWNLFLIVSSHDFEESETKADLTRGQDWGVFQVANSFDMSVVGNPYVDCFLTAGLGCHRAHHVLPAQRSGFANILSEPAVRKTCEEFGIAWKPTKNFVWHRLPGLFIFYMFAPARLADERGGGFLRFMKENLSLEGYRRIAHFVFFGFRGVGSI
jgi:hypothetical protein